MSHKHLKMWQHTSFPKADADCDGYIHYAEPLSE